MHASKTSVSPEVRCDRNSREAGGQRVQLRGAPGSFIGGPGFLTGPMHRFRAGPCVRPDPTISIALCTYNGARFLGAQIESIARQTVLPSELVVTDDQSSDGTAEIVEAWRTRVPFPIRWEVNPTRLRSTRNFERSIGLCTGDLIALSDQDDVWLPDKLERARRALARPDAVAYFADAEIVDERLVRTGRRLWDSVGFDQRSRDAFRRGDGDRIVLRDSFVTGATLVFRASLRELATPFPTELVRCIHDRWLGLLATALGTLAWDPEPSMLYRQHAAQQLGAGGADAGDRESERFRPNWRERHDELEVMRALESRLAPRTDVRPSYRALVVDRRRHLEVRDRLHGVRRLRRVAPVLAELIRGGYARHASGALSAAKDVVLP